MANTLMSEKVRALRFQGKSLKEISQKFLVPKSTVSYWCRDITLSKSQFNHLRKKQEISGLLAAEKMRRDRINTTKALLKSGIGEVGNLSSRELLLVGAALYWAEGYRKGDGEFGFSNSDPRMLKIIIKWLTKSCEISRDLITLRVCINYIHQKRIRPVHTFWSRATGIPLSQFSKPTLIKVENKKIYSNHSHYFGTLRIKVRRSTNLRRRILGWIAGLSKNSAR